MTCKKYRNVYVYAVVNKFCAKQLLSFLSFLSKCPPKLALKKENRKNIDCTMYLLICRYVIIDEKKMYLWGSLLGSNLWVVNLNPHLVQVCISKNTCWYEYVYQLHWGTTLLKLPQFSCTNASDTRYTVNS